MSAPTVAASATSAAVSPAGAEAGETVTALLTRARAASGRLERAGQAAADAAALAAAWALLRPAANRRLADMAVQTTGLGCADDKVAKNRRKTLGLLRDMRGARTLGVVREDAKNGLTEILRPMGAVAAITPSTNPVATPANNIINALKTGNAIILAPSPKGMTVAAELLKLIWAEFARARLPVADAADLVQMLPAARREMTQELMRGADAVVVTGSQNNVRAGYASGTPCLGVGAGNVPVIIDETADVAAARLIADSKTFDNATSCSSENSAILVGAQADAAQAALAQAGGLLLEADDKARLQRLLWPDGKLSRDLIAQDAGALLAALNAARASEGLDALADAGIRFLMVAETGVGADFPFSGEKMSPVLTLYRAADFAAAADMAERLLNHQGRGHSVGLHTKQEARAVELGLRLPACRVIVNQAHCFATGGAFNNGLPFSLSMGCGAWGGNSFSDNFNFRHLSQRVVVSRPIDKREPAAAEIFADYWEATGENTRALD